MNILKSSAVKVMGLLLLGVAFSAHGVSDKQRADIEARIKPVGQVCQEGGEGCGGAVVATATGGAGAKSAEDIYNTNCMACHSTGAAGAPKLGDAGEWAGRLGKGADQLYTNAINGFKGMPPKGLCMSCSDDELKSVVDYIVENSK